MKTKYDRVIKIFLLLIPTTLLLLVVIYPLIYTVIMAFRNESGDFVGLYNFVRAFKDPQFFASVKSTLIYAATAISIELFLGMGLAFYVTNRIHNEVLKYIVYLSFIVPLVTPQIASGIIFRLLYIPNYGAINRILHLLGFEFEPGWLTNPSLAVASAVSVDVWQWLPFVFLVFYAGFQSVPLDILEAAKVDGASTWMIFRKMQLPFMKPLILLVLIFRISDSLRVFDHVMVLTQGGPGRATEFLSIYLYKIAFKFWDLNYSAAISLFILVFMSVLSLFLSKNLKTEVD